VERAYFLNILFRFPLSEGRLSSGYGPRKNPFTGHPEFHQGIDIAAPFGTDVVAARDGVVSLIGVDPVLGRYIQLLHEGGYETIYGHLSNVTVSLKQQIGSGMILGKVGSTGYSTGPHLHFEIRRKGKSKNPSSLLPANR
jgi:murein DD-endopeptidase MepM/ murein hydrolase activator NlpD